MKPLAALVTGIIVSAIFIGVFINLWPSMQPLIQVIQGSTHGMPLK